MLIRRGDIWTANLGENDGSEQSGLRPVIIIQNNIGNEHSRTFNVLPLTGSIKKKNLPPHHILKDSTTEKPSLVLAEGITTIDISKLINFKGIVSSEDMRIIERKLAYQLGLVQCLK